MNLLVTAGNTLTLIDRVRCITNVFTGRTGAAIALHAHRRGHAVTLLTSHPEALNELRQGRDAGGDNAADPSPPAERWRLYPYRTFEELQTRMREVVSAGGLDAVV